MIDLKQFEFWFVTGSQHLYGPEALKKSPPMRDRSPPR